MRRLLQRLIMRSAFAAFFALATPAALADLASGKSAYATGNYALALKELQPLAKSGDPEAQVLVGTMYAKGQGVEKNEAGALEWYYFAAEQGNSEAQIALSDMFSTGRGTERNSVLAAYWQWKAANSFMTAAKNELLFEINKANIQEVDLDVNLKEKSITDFNREGKPRACIPNFPILSQRSDFQGTTVFSVLFDFNGKSQEINLIQSSGLETLDNAVKAAFGRCKFAEKEVDGHAVQNFSIFKYFWNIHS